MIPTPPTELVQLYDAAGRPTGTATRQRMRAENLTHAATAVVLRDLLGRVHVHRRTDTKDVYPGRFDFAAGGVVDADEEPAVAAARELAEELGVIDVELKPIGVARYRDEHTDYWGHCFTATWAGEVRLQREEVAWGAWWPLERLVTALKDPDWPVVPDTVGLLAGWLRERLADRHEVSEQGWDSHVEIVEGRWVDRIPRRPEIAAALVVETQLMPRLAPLLPLAVPVPTLLDTDPPRARHLLVRGVPVDPDLLDATESRRVGGFLRALHDVPEPVWAGTDLGEDSARLPMLAQMRDQVVPLLPRDLQQAGLELLERCGTALRLQVLRHGDLGPEHLLTTGGRISGVIDWTDVALGDPALDLAWLVHRTPPAFADALVSTYGASREEAARGRDWHLLGPWWEVRHGLHHAGREYVESGLAGVVDRLRGTP